MSVFAIVADLVMGALLGLFLFVVLRDIWPVLDRAVIAAVVIGASALLVVVHRRHRRRVVADGAVKEGRGPR